MRGWLVAGAAALALGGTARAEDAPAKPLRLIGESATAGAKAFVLDLVVTPGDEPFQSQVKGWYAALPPDTASGSVDGSCVENRCALSVDLDDGKLALTGDLTAAAPGTGKLQLTSGDADKPASGSFGFHRLDGPVPGLGALADPASVSGPELSGMLAWQGHRVASGLDDEVNDSVREKLAEWQAESSLPGPGLLLPAQLDSLRAKTAAARTAAGWTPLGGAGWSAGYPAALLPKATKSAGEQRFDSADGTAHLVIALGPPLDGEGFDKLWDEAKTHSGDGEGVSYTRVNNDFEMSWTSKDVTTVMVGHNREGGLARMTYTFPAKQADRYGAFEEILPATFKVADELKAP